jgi:hypothetical protein
LLLSLGVQAQNQHKRAVFLGNSYTYSNNLPQLIAEFAQTTGDTLTHSSSTPGGSTLQGHTSNTTSLNLIGQSGWDHMILQEQSQRPSFPDVQVQNSVYPYAYTLDTTFHNNNPCGETIFFMTWGRENGDATNCPVWPPVCTYEGMDSLLHLRYRIMADSNKALLSPVGELWHYIRENHSGIDLYQSDESHPSYAGSFAAACAFYAIIFQKDPSLTTYNGQLNATTANTIRAAAKTVVYDSLLYWNVGRFYPKADFNYTYITADSIQFVNSSEWSDDYYWDFGDGNVSTNTDPVQLISSRCGRSDTLELPILIDLSITEPEGNECHIFPNPITDFLEINCLNWSPTEYSLIDLRGNRICQGIVEDTRVAFLDCFIIPGTYVLMLQGGNHHAQFLILKE